MTKSTHYQASIAILRDALFEINERLRSHPAWEDLTEDEECDVGGITAEFSYLSRVAAEALSFVVGKP